MEYNCSSLPLSCWAAEDIPANKLDANGVVNLTNTELLSIIIGGGTNDANSLELARKVLYKNNNSLRKLSSSTISEIMKINGIGKATVRKMLAALELGVRSVEESRNKTVVNSAATVYNLLYPALCGLDVEEFWLIMLDNGYNLIKKKRMFVGGITEVAVDIRLLMKDAILNNAVMIDICHNHPSGSIRPSRQDDELTQSVKKACQILRIKLNDHVIICDGCYYSYWEEGKL